MESKMKDLQKRTRELEKRLEFIEMQTAENISNIDKLWRKIDDQQEINILHPNGIMRTVSEGKE